MTGWNFDTTYRNLPSAFFSDALPTRAPAPKLLVLNAQLALELHLSPEDLKSNLGVAHLVGNALPPGATPLAQAYAGHQFGHFTMLGDGRAILLGEHVAPTGSRFDIQLKGPGQTPYSRRGDGRAAVGPMLREYLISEAMAALSIPTTRSLAVVATGESVYREQPLPGAVLTRVAASHIRVGTFEFAAAKGGKELTTALADYSILRHYPEILQADNRYLEFLRRVISRQVDLVTKWMLVGFIHGVMNTDNISICGETIDYGPCAFMDTYNPSTVFSSIDRDGRYSYENQAPILQWNLARFAETLLPLISPSPEESLNLATRELDRIPDLFQSKWLSGMRTKIGLVDATEDDSVLIEELLIEMSTAQLDFTRTFRSLSKCLDTPEDSPAPLIAWVKERWIKRVMNEGRRLSEVASSMNHANPARIPRNYRVEEALKVAMEQEDLSAFMDLVAVCTSPYEDEHYLVAPPPASWGGYRTFCGT